MPIDNRAHLLVAAFLLSMVPVLGTAEAGDESRYRAYPGDPIILLDTHTGKSWTYGKSGKWEPIEFLSGQAAGTKSPGESHLPIARSSKDFKENRRLKLLQPGGTPKPKTKWPNKAQ